MILLLTAICRGSENAGAGVIIQEDEGSEDGGAAVLYSFEIKLERVMVRSFSDASCAAFHVRAARPCGDAALSLVFQLWRNTISAKTQARNLWILC